MSRFSAGSSMLARRAPVIASRASASRRAATGSFSAQARGTGGPSPRGARVGSSSSGSSATSRRASTHCVGVAGGAAAVEALGAQQRRRSPGMAMAAATIAESGRIRPGVTSRSRGDLVAGLPQRADRAQRPSAADPVQPDVRRHGSTRGVGAKPRTCVELLPGPVVLAGLDQLGGEHVAQLDQHLDVERGVLEPGPRQRPGRPVDRGVLLGEPAGRAASRPGWPARPAGSRAAGRRARCRRASAGTRPELGQAGQVLGGGVDDPLGARRAPPAAGPAWSGRSGRPGGCPEPSRRSWMR